VKHLLRRELPGMVAGLLGCLLLVVLGTRNGMAVLPSSGAGLVAAVGQGGTVVQVRADTVLADQAVLSPGRTSTTCTTVTYSGSTAGSLSAYTDSVGSAGGLDRLIAIKLETGTGGPRDCAQLDGARTLYAGPMSEFPRAGRSTSGVALTGVGTEATRFRISYTLAADAPTSAEGETTPFRIQWLVQT
jgi:hypothetical protein